MALTRVSPSLFATSNNITSVTVGGSANTISLTFDASGVITSASNNAVSVANTAITGNIISSQITSVANTQLTGTITGSQISSNTLSNTVFQTGSVENYMSAVGLDVSMRNKIINGAMQIDQRNAGVSVTPTNGLYTLDRWAADVSQSSKFTVIQSSTAPAGFSKSLLVTSSSAYTVGTNDYFALHQFVEGFNTADFNFGLASATYITLSFWVRSSLTGTFGVGLRGASDTRSYTATYTINSANTFEYKTINIPGDTSGTWLTNSGVGIGLFFSLGVGSANSITAGSWQAVNATSPTGATSVVGTNGATWYVTGIQLEKGSTATPFGFRNYGTELQMCQRYYQQTNSFTAVGVSASSNIYAYITFPVTMRSSPSIGQTAALQITDGVTNDWSQSSTGISINSSRVSIHGITFTGDNFSSVTAYRPYFAKHNVTGLVTLNAEL